MGVVAVWKLILDSSVLNLKKQKSAVNKCELPVGNSLGKSEGTYPELPIGNTHGPEGIFIAKSRLFLVLFPNFSSLLIAVLRIINSLQC